MMKPSTLACLAMAVIAPALAPASALAQTIIDQQRKETRQLELASSTVFDLRRQGSKPLHLTWW